MNIVLLSGGSGKRLWPLSNDVRSKQFIKMFRNEAGELESMVQRVYRQIKTVMPEAEVTIATSKKQVSAIHNQLGDKVGVSVEPDRRDTFPAIALAAAYLQDVKGVKKNEAVLVCPVDPYVELNYFERLKDLAKLAEKGTTNLSLLGIEPTYPSEKYGYILPTSAEQVAIVDTFKEKPDVETAKEYIKKGALWNGGVFAFQLGYLLEKAHEYLNFENYADLFEHYSDCTKISFDYAVVEKEASIQVMRFHGEWKDIGTWNTFTEEMAEPVIGQGVLNKTCENTSIINELNIPVLGMGLENIVVAASVDGILVSNKEQSSYIKPFVDEFSQQVMFAEKSWGSFTVLDVLDTSMTIKIVLLPGHRLNYHSHEHRDEVWTVMEGTGRAIIDGQEKEVKAGDVLAMPAGCKHTISAITKLQVIEVQLGKEINVADKQKYEFPSK